MLRMCAHLIVLIVRSKTRGREALACNLSTREREEGAQTHLQKLRTTRNNLLTRLPPIHLTTPHQLLIYALHLATNQALEGSD